MNDTEDAVRRLFTVATQDIPPGINLGHDIRARSRARVLRARVVLSAGLAAIVAAATVITLSAVRPASALAQVTQAATRTAGQSYRVTSTRTLMRAPGAPTADKNPVTIIGEFDPARSVGEETAGGTQIRYVGSYLYIPVFGAFRRAHPSPPPKWVKLHVPPRSSTEVTPGDVISLGGITGVEPFDPQDLLALLKSASHVREVGPASGPGWKGSAYTFDVTLRTSVQPHQVLKLSGTVDVDQQGRVRRLDAVESVENTVSKVQMTFGDFGIHVSVSAPPADETVSP
jgi:hypothetical protein